MLRWSWLCTLVIGCTHSGFVEPKTPPIEPFGAAPAGYGQICVVRPHGFKAAAVTVTVRDNGKLVGATRGASYFCYYAAPGKHRITSEADDVQEAGVLVSPGVRYFAWQKISNTLGWVSSPMEWMSEAEAHAQIVKCDYRLLSEAPDGVELPPANPVAAAQP